MLRFLFAVLLLAALPASAQIGAPVQSWAYGGCFASFCQTGWYSGPAVADIDADGLIDVVWGSYDTVALNGIGGGLKWRATNGQRVWPAIAVGNFDPVSPGLESAVGRGRDSTTFHQLYLYSSTGALLWSRAAFPTGEVRSLAAADLDGNGDLEIVVGRGSGGSFEQVNVYEHDGSVRPGWPARRTGELGNGWGMYNENLTIGDLDADGQMEIYAPTDTHYITALHPSGDQLIANVIYGLTAGQPKKWSQVGVHVDHAADLVGFATCGVQHRPNFANAAPAIADMDGDGSLELVVPGDVYNCAIGDPAGDLYYLPWILKRDRTRWAASGYDWTILPPPGQSGAATTQDFNVIENAVVNAVPADLDGDGDKEILFASYDGKVHAWWLDKTEKHSWPYTVPGTGFRFAAEPAVVDLDNDGFSEVIFTTWPQKGGGAVGRLIILSYQGTLLHSVNLPAPRGSATWNGGLGAPTVAQLDTDPNFEVVVGTSSSGVVAYEIPGSGNAVARWGTARGNLLRNGQAPGTSPGELFRNGFE